MERTGGDSDDEPVRKTPKASTPERPGTDSSSSNSPQPQQLYFQRIPEMLEEDDEDKNNEKQNVRRNLFPTTSTQHETDTSESESDSESEDQYMPPFQDTGSEDTSNDDEVIPPTPELFSDEGEKEGEQQPPPPLTPADAAAAKHKMLQPCKCKKKCLSSIDENRRKDLHQQLWSMTYYNRKQFIASHVERFTPKRRRSAGIKTPKMSRRYFLPNEKGQRIETCQRFFLGTLGFTSDSVIRAVFSTTPRNAAEATTDQRGKKAPVNKLKENTLTSIKEHINSYHPCVSHYRRKHAPNRKYLPLMCPLTKCTQTLTRVTKELKSVMRLIEKLLRK